MHINGKEFYTAYSIKYSKDVYKRQPYSISGYTHENEEKMLIYSLDRTQTFGYLSRHSGIRQLELFLKDGSGNLKYRYTYTSHEEDYHNTTYENIVAKYENYASYFIQDVYKRQL